MSSFSRVEKFFNSDPQLYKEVIDAGCHGLALLDQVGNFLFINDFLCNFLGYDGEELLGNSLLSIIPIEYQKKSREEYLQFFDQKTTNTIKWMLQSKSGEFIETLVGIKVVETTGNQSLAVASFVHISEAQQQDLLEKRLGRIIEHSFSEIYLLSTQDFKYLQVNQGALKNLGYSLDEIQKLTAYDLNPYLKKERAIQILEPLKKGKAEIVKFETVHQRKDGSHYDVEVRLQLMRDEEPEVILAIARDITKQKRKDLKMHILSRVIEQGNDWVLITDKEGNIIYVNEAVERMSGYSKQEILGQKPSLWKSGQHADSFYDEMWQTVLAGNPYRNIVVNKGKTGDLFYLDSNIIPILNHKKEVTYFVATAKDITADKFMEERLTYLAYYDGLTTLPNRTFFTEQIHLEVKRAKEAEELLAILNLDISRFVYVNETYGNEVGDAVLKQVAQRLTGFSKGEDMLARISGDNFGIILSGFKDTNEIAAIVDRMIKALTKPMLILGQELVLSINVGVSVYPEDGDEAEQLISKSELALNKASKKGRNMLQFFTNDMNRSASDFLMLEKNIYKAKDNDEFVVYYQPYFDIYTEEMRGMESLLRWQSPKLGLISPGQFIPLLEETGLIIEVGQKIVTKVCAQLVAWQKEGRKVVPVAINLSPIQFRQKDLVEVIIKTVQEYQLDPRLVVLEVTESTFMDDLERTHQLLKKIKDNGFTISIDDFGTGYSSLAYLKKFPVDNLKIDLSFIRDIHLDQDGASIVNAIVSMAHNLHLKTIAEGIETLEELEILRVLECDIGQGYFWHRPVAGNEVNWSEEAMEVLDAEPEI